MDPSNPPIIWLDANIADSSNQAVAKIITAKYPNNQLREENDLNETIRLIQRITGRNFTVIIIVSGHFGEELTKNIHDNPYVLSINVFCGNKQRAERWGNHFRKVKVMIQTQELIDTIQDNLNQFSER